MIDLNRDELQVLLWACEHEILRLPSERNEQQTLALLSTIAKVREAYQIACALDAGYRVGVTGETISDAEIRKLWDEADASGNMRIATDCAGALSSLSPSTRGLLRERCAAAWNRRRS